MAHLATHHVLLLVVVVDDQVAAHIHTPLVGSVVGSYCRLDPRVPLVRITPAGKEVLVSLLAIQEGHCLVGLDQQPPDTSWCMPPSLMESLILVKSNIYLLLHLPS